MHAMLDGGVRAAGQQRACRAWQTPGLPGPGFPNRGRLPAASGRAPALRAPTAAGPTCARLFSRTRSQPIVAANQGGGAVPAAQVLSGSSLVASVGGARLVVGAGGVHFVSVSIDGAQLVVGAGLGGTSGLGGSGAGTPGRACPCCSG